MNYKFIVDSHGRFIFSFVDSEISNFKMLYFNVNEKLIDFHGSVEKDFIVSSADRITYDDNEVFYD